MLCTQLIGTVASATNKGVEDEPGAGTRSCDGYMTCDMLADCRPPPAVLHAYTDGYKHRA